MDDFTKDEIEGKQDRNRLLLQLSILSLAILYGFYQFTTLDFGDQTLTLLIGVIILFYIFVLFVRIGLWIAFGLFGIAMIFFLLKEDLPTGLYCFGALSYGAIGLYNLHIALFWQAEEYDIIPENIETNESVKI